ncbi:MAG TPA: hypothetical protein PK668_24100 [Myxococcota bacterium]|nr:hypothetical protein [Myxococcota bacterium]HRY95345.1 hypothetical protein [Myxococcota bacterium]HSA21188.1 hypothetical protein [Myxococcota bacterium]
MTRAHLLLVALLQLLWLAAPRAAEPAAPGGDEGESVVLGPDQTLEDLASLRYEDARAAEEIRALNGLAPGAAPAPGQRLRLPGKARRPAIMALGVAGQALQDARLQGAAEFAVQRHQAAVAGLELAEAACRRTDYVACLRLADDAFALARLARQESLTRRAQANRFAVSVAQDGGTRVEVLAGDGVEVSAQAQSTRLRPGQGLQVHPGKAPEAPQALPEPPEQLLPYPDSRLITPSILFSWKPGPGAQRTVLLLARDAAGLRPIRQLTVQEASFLFQSKLPNGDYYWFLRSVDARGAVGRATPARRFSLHVEQDGQEIRVEPPPAPAPANPPGAPP